MRKRNGWRKNRSKEGKKRERDGEGAEKEDRHFNNSQTLASFRIESVPKLDLCVLRTWHTIHSSWLTHRLCVFCVSAFVQELAKQCKDMFSQCDDVCIGV